LKNLTPEMNPSRYKAGAMGNLSGKELALENGERAIGQRADVGVRCADHGELVRRNHSGTDLPGDELNAEIGLDVRE
jgi:hypothetical protein